MVIVRVARVLMVVVIAVVDARHIVVVAIVIIAVVDATVGVRLVITLIRTRDLLVKDLPCHRIIDNFENAATFGRLNPYFSWAIVDFDPLVTLRRQLGNHLICDGFCVGHIGGQTEKQDRSFKCIFHGHVPFV